MGRSVQLLVAAVACVCVATAAPECRTTFASPTATFDLSALMKSHSHYFSNDTYYDAGRPFTYYFNVCDDTEENLLPLPAADKNMCKVGEGATSYAAAYQLIAPTPSTPNGQCFRLGEAQQMEWTLLDETDTTIGVQLTYKGGGQCPGEANVQRSFAVNFKCIEEGTTLPPVSAVEEGTFCNYEVTIESIYGCPLECHSVTHDELCSGHGLCAVDQGLGAARCFCNEGRSGSLCEQVAKEEKKGASATSVLVTLVILLLIALLLLAAVLFVKIRKLNTEDNPYGAMEDQRPNTALN